MIKKIAKKSNEKQAAKSPKKKAIKVAREKVEHKPIVTKKLKTPYNTQKEIDIKEEKKVEEVNIEPIAEDIDKKSKTVKTHKYYEAIGRRKNAIARVRISPIKTNEMREPIFLSNNKSALVYFSGLELMSIIEAPFKLMKMVNKFDITIITSGGGIHSQAEAARLGISRALLEFNKTFRKKLKRAGFLERDSRKKERKKPGLKKARRAPQWQKR